jgi:hypothetical protein
MRSVHYFWDNPRIIYLSECLSRIQKIMEYNVKSCLTRKPIFIQSFSMFPPFGWFQRKLSAEIFPNYKFPTLTHPQFLIRWVCFKSRSQTCLFKSFCVSVRPYAYNTRLAEKISILNWQVSRKSVDTFQFCVRSYNNDGNLTWRPIYVSTCGSDWIWNLEWEITTSSVTWGILRDDPITPS